MGHTNNLGRLSGWWGPARPRRAIPDVLTLSGDSDEEQGGNKSGKEALLPWRKAPSDDGCIAGIGPTG